MADFSMEYGRDLALSPGGDYAFASGDVLLRQLVVRALATNAREVRDDGTALDPECWYHPDYGASLGRVVGSSISANSGLRGAYENRIRIALAQVAGVSKVQRPRIQLSVVAGGVRVVVAFTSAATNTTVTVGPLLFQS